MSDVKIYAVGSIHCSVCVPKEMPLRQIEDFVSRNYPTGLDHGWTVSKEATFAGGEPNPCRCGDDPDRLHYLMAC
jgi:hypothetical protein